MQHCFVILFVVERVFEMVPSGFATAKNWDLDLRRTHTKTRSHEKTRKGSNASSMGRRTSNNQHSASTSDRKFRIFVPSCLRARQYRDHFSQDSGLIQSPVLTPLPASHPRQNTAITTPLRENRQLQIHLFVSV